MAVPDPLPVPYRPGNPEDFERLYSDSYARLLFVLLGILRDRAAAEDCLQEAATRGFRAWPRWKPEAPAEVWLHRIALNAAFSYRRRERLREAGELIRRLGRPGTEPSVEDLGEAGGLFAALRRLAPSDAAVILLRHHHGYTNREIAASLGLPESTVSSRLITAKRKLRELLDSETETS